MTKFTQQQLDEIEDNLSFGMVVYIDPRDGRILVVPSYEMDGDFEAWQDDIDFVEENVPHLTRIEPMGSHESFNIMERFIDTVPSRKHQEALVHALEKRKPFRNFKDKVFNIGLIDQWYAFKNDQEKAYMLEQLGQVPEQNIKKNDDESEDTASIKTGIAFDLTKEQRQEILEAVTSALEVIYNDPKDLAVSTEIDIQSLKEATEAFSFGQENNAVDVMLHVIESLKEHSVHITHPSYFGLFNPRANFPSIMADVISSYVNPQMAAWSHAAYACEIENLLIKEIGSKFGYNTDQLDGTFCTGGAESNLTAVLCALQKHIPNLSEEGVIGLKKRPLIYGSAESHHSLEKATKTAGIGRSAVRQVPVKDDQSMDINALKKQIEKDLADGYQPIMVVGTAGTTGAGAIDDLQEIAAICKTNNLWFHVDAAYGGAAIITELKAHFKGIELSNSITLDLHKWFSVPMATSLYLTSDNDVLHQTFGVHTDYMPAKIDKLSQVDPFTHSIQWSRRFIGLKIYLPLAVFGWKGYAETISHQAEMGNKLRSLLIEGGWEIKNQSLLPIVCFTHGDLNKDDNAVIEIVKSVVHSGAAWVSTYPVNGELTIRACITNYATQVEDLEALVELLCQAKNNA